MNQLRLPSTRVKVTLERALALADISKAPVTAIRIYPDHKDGATTGSDLSVWPRTEMLVGVTGKLDTTAQSHVDVMFHNLQIRAEKMPVDTSGWKRPQLGLDSSGLKPEYHTKVDLGGEIFDVKATTMVSQSESGNLLTPDRLKAARAIAELIGGQDLVLRSLDVHSVPDGVVASINGEWQDEPARQRFEDMLTANQITLPSEQDLRLRGVSVPGEHFTANFCLGALAM